MKFSDNTKILYVDLYSGSFNDENIGHEIFNNVLDPVDDKYYGYVPPYDSVNLEKLGASKTDDFIDNILVVFTKKASHNNSDRKILGYYPSARVYKERRFTTTNDRVLKKSNGEKSIASYTLESSQYIEIESLFIIKCSEIHPWMFRGQRMYSGKYPELDREVINFLNNDYESKTSSEPDEVEFQDVIQKTPTASEKEIKIAPTLDIEISKSNSLTMKRNPKLSKAAIERNKFQCEIDSDHETFLSKNRNQYMEGHHLIPITIENAEYYYSKFRVNLDCLQNIVPLCPNCHRAIHLADEKTRKKMITHLYQKRLNELNDVGIKLEITELLGSYGL